MLDRARVRPFVACFVIVVWAACGHSKSPAGPGGGPTPDGAGPGADAAVNLPDAYVHPPHVAPDHIVIVVEENHATGQILGNNVDAPYFNALAAQGELFTRSFAIEHPSQPNYLDLFSGNNQGITDDSCPHSFGADNLASELIAAGKTFVGYSEDLPGAGSDVCQNGGYWRKHAPWTNFTNVPGTAGQPMTSWPTDFTQLPTVSWVIPNLNDDMHDGTIAQADQWLHDHVDAYAQWAKTHNSLLIVTFDEDDNVSGNQIFTIVVGADIPQRQAVQRISHWNVLRTLTSLYNLGPLGPNAQPIDLWNYAPTDVRRTVVFVHGVTQPGQDMFVRGGLDYTYAYATLGRDCNADPGACQIFIHHRNLLNPSTMGFDVNDDHLDWLGSEPNQDSNSFGSPTDWTTNQWPSSWGPQKTVATDGYGVETLNTMGSDYWMLDVDMDCLQTVGGWFELKSFITNGPGWESDVSQSGTPYPSTNHMGQCGKINVFDRGSSSADIHNF